MVSTIRDKLLNAGMTSPPIVPPGRGWGGCCVLWLPQMKAGGDGTCREIVLKLGARLSEVVRSAG